MSKKCDENDNECKTCEAKNCNSLSSFRKCIDCKMMFGTDMYCATNPQVMNNKVCRNYNDECYTTIEKFTISRGCMSNQNEKFRKECIENPEKCGICMSTSDKECNNKAILLEKCVACDSNIYDYSCNSKPELYKDKICNVLTDSKSEGCYLSVVSLLKYRKRLFLYFNVVFSNFSLKLLH